MRDLGASILTRLKKQAQETGLNYQMCLQLFCQEEFLRRLSFSPYCSHFVLKGGLLIYTLTNFQSRATQDIDFLMRKMTNEMDKVKKVMEEIVNVSTENDFVSFEVLEAKVITQEKEYPGVSVKFVGRIKQVRVPFSIDLGVDDVIVPEAVVRSLKTRLPDFEEPKVYTYSLESTIAEKFDAILKRMEGTSRMKDFFDIYYLSSIFEFDGQMLKDAIGGTITHRATPYDKNSFERINNFYSNAFLVSQWKRFQLSIQMELPEFDLVLNRLKQFLEPIFDALINDKEFFLKWSVDHGIWEKIN
ncbi:MAG: nucleotidyl transferase AbiEii/AbiGii toxin family protein [Clostridiales bacterium]|nr:nucleotidyl transferase AbiEii/AbiGii toxin family protein [Clostridiales bacterium]